MARTNQNNNTEAEEAAKASGPPAEHEPGEEHTPESDDALSTDPIDNGEDATPPKEPEPEQPADEEENLTPAQKAARTRAANKAAADAKAKQKAEKDPLDMKNKPAAFVVDTPEEAEKYFKAGYLVRKLQSGNGRAATYKYKVYKNFKNAPEMAEVQEQVPEEVRGL